MQIIFFISNTIFHLGYVQRTCECVLDTNARKGVQNAQSSFLIFFNPLSTGVTNRRTDRLTDRLTHIQTNRQTDKQTDTHTNKQTDGQTGKQEKAVMGLLVHKF